MFQVEDGASTLRSGLITRFVKAIHFPQLDAASPSTRDTLTDTSEPHSGGGGGGERGGEGEGGGGGVAALSPAVGPDSSVASSGGVGELGGVSEGGEQGGEWSVGLGSAVLNGLQSDSFGPLSATHAGLQSDVFGSVRESGDEGVEKGEGAGVAGSVPGEAVGLQSDSFGPVRALLMSDMSSASALKSMETTYGVEVRA